MVPFFLTSKKEKSTIHYKIRANLQISSLAQYVEFSTFLMISLHDDLLGDLGMTIFVSPVTEDRVKWRVIGEAYIQQWAAKGR